MQNIIKNASLIIVGSGIKFMSHLTIEAKANIEQADKVLYLINEPLMESWINEANPNTESLEKLYTNYTLRNDSYHAITRYILEKLYEQKHICVVIYGHPTVFAKPALEAVIEAKVEGYYAKILPGISAEDCLFADLLINPGSVGCQSFEATDLLVHRRKIDPSCHLILWQISIIGELTHVKKIHPEKGLKMLLEYLKKYYSLNHEVILYTAAQYPGLEPVITRVRLEQLPNTIPLRLSTLYIPPSNKSSSDKFMLHLLTQ